MSTMAIVSRLSIHQQHRGQPDLRRSKTSAVPCVCFATLALLCAFPRRGLPSQCSVSWLQSENDLLGSSYANALVDLASDKNNLEEVHADMDALASILKVRGTLCSTVGT